MSMQSNPLEAQRASRDGAASSDPGLDSRSADGLASGTRPR